MIIGQKEERSGRTVEEFSYLAAAYSSKHESIEIRDRLSKSGEGRVERDERGEAHPVLFGIVAVLPIDACGPEI